MVESHFNKADIDGDSPMHDCLCEECVKHCRLGSHFLALAFQNKENGNEEYFDIFESEASYYMKLVGNCCEEDWNKIWYLYMKGDNFYE